MPNQSDSTPERNTLVLRSASDQRDVEAQHGLAGAALLIGSIVGGKYKIDSELGRGGMGAVYRAHHVDLLKAVALKTLLPEHACDAQSRKRFTREARAASNVKHDNVVDVYDFGIDAERSMPFLVMELLSGLPLRIYLQQRRQLDWREALGIMLPCMRGVAAAHKRGIVHRDLKPENIFICESDDPDARRVKVLDFGVAAALDADPDGGFDSVITRTASRTVVGTAYYMPPEQLAGAKVDVRADVYALGVILYEMLAGRRPYGGETSSDVSTAIYEGRAAPLYEISSVEPALSELVQRAMARSASDRFGDITEMICAFQQFSRQQREGTGLTSSTAASVEALAQSTARPAHASRRMVWAGLITAVALVAAVLFWVLGEPKQAGLVGDRKLPPIAVTARPIPTARAVGGVQAESATALPVNALSAPEKRNATEPHAGAQRTFRRAPRAVHTPEAVPVVPVETNAPQAEPAPDPTTGKRRVSEELMGLRPDYGGSWK